MIQFPLTLNHCDVWRAFKNDVVGVFELVSAGRVISGNDYHVFVHGSDTLKIFNDRERQEMDKQLLLKHLSEC